MDLHEAVLGEVLHNGERVVTERVVTERTIPGSRVFFIPRTQEHQLGGLPFPFSFNGMGKA
jgi:hypothetical protein